MTDVLSPMYSETDIEALAVYGPIHTVTLSINIYDYRTL